MWSATRVHSWPTLFLMYISDLGPVSVYITPIMFTDDINLFCSHNNATDLFEKATYKLKRILQWFKSNTFLSNESKTRFDLFHRPCDREPIHHFNF